MSARHATRERLPAPSATRAGASDPTPTATTWVDRVLIVLLWCGFVAWVSRGHLVVSYDSFRDMAYTHGILRGELGQDPSLAGFPAWYPPALPLLFAGIARVTGAAVVAVHGTSLYWLSALLPLTLHLVVAKSLGRAAAWWSLAFVFLGSVWWLTHAAMPMPSVQGVAFGWLTLLAWLAWRSRGWPWALAVGAIGALTVAIHPICGGMAMASVLVHGVLRPLFAGPTPAERDRARREAARAAIAFLLWAALAALLLWPLLSGPIRNPAPRLWFGPQLRDPLYALHAHAPLVLVLGPFGLVRAARAWEGAGWLVAYAIVSLPLLLAGYAAVVLQWPIPFLLPHEFQWHLQLAWCVAAALAMLELARSISRRWRLGMAGRVMLTAGIAALALGPALARLPLVALESLVLDEGWAPVRTLADRLQALGASGRVIAVEPSVGYLLSGIAGTRALLLPAGHMNPRADFDEQLRAVETLLQASDESTFVTQLERTPTDYLIHNVQDTTQRRMLLQRHERWTVVEPLPFEYPNVLLYRIGPRRSDATPLRAGR